MTDSTLLFDAAVTGDRGAVRSSAEALAAVLAADPGDPDAWAALPAAQWAAEQTALTGYAELFNTALPAALALRVAAGSGGRLPEGVAGAWAARLDPTLDAERRAGIDAALADAVAGERERRGVPTPEPFEDEPSTVFPRGFMAALTRLRSAALPVPPLYTAALRVVEAPVDEPAEPRPARPLGELLDALVALEDLEWRRPATEKQIATLEQRTGVTLPADYRAFLERANGSKDREFEGAHEVARDAKELLGYAEEEIADEDDPAAARAAFTNDGGSGRVAPGGFVRGWLPVYDHGTGEFVILDCAPGPEGTAGQVLSYGEAETRVTHPDFRAWLQDHVEDLED